MVEERLRRRERLGGWVLFGLFLLAIGLIGGLALLALPLLAVAFPITLGAIVLLLIVGWWRQRRSG